jgi:hypothetical protein
MSWYNYIANFFAGMFLANAVPHFVYGIGGDKLPTPFAKPPGKGLSSSTVNVVWALFNMVIGYLLFRAGKGLGWRRCDAGGLLCGDCGDQRYVEHELCEERSRVIFV